MEYMDRLQSSSTNLKKLDKCLNYQLKIMDKLSEHPPFSTPCGDSTNANENIVTFTTK